MTKVAIYTRISRKNEDGYSLSNQRDDGIAWCRQQGREYLLFEEGVQSSDTELKYREKGQELINAIEVGLVDTIWVFTTSRLFRNTAESAVFYEEYIHTEKIKIIENGKDVNDELLFGIHGLLNSMYKRYAKQQSYRGIKRAIKEGKFQGKIPPYGFKKNEEKYLVIDEDEAEVYRLMVRLAIKGYSSFKIATALNAKGIKTRYEKIREVDEDWRQDIAKDGKWKSKVVDDILTNDFYSGTWYWGAEKIEIKNKYSIISNEDWLELQQTYKAWKKKRNGEKTIGKGRKHKYVYRNLMWCKHCGRKLIGVIKSDERTYKCMGKHTEGNIGKRLCSLRSLNLSYMEEYVFASILGKVFSVGMALGGDYFTDEEVELNRMQILYHKNQNEEYNKLIAERENEDVEVIRMNAQGKITDDQLIRTQETIRKEISAYKMEIDYNVIKIVQLEKEAGLYEGYTNLYQVLINIAENRDAENRNEFLMRWLIDKILVENLRDKEHRLEIHMKFSWEENNEITNVFVKEGRFDYYAYTQREDQNPMNWSEFVNRLKKYRLKSLKN